MSFFGVGDFIAVANLARTVYKRCRDSPSQYRRLTREASELSNTLQNLEDLLHEAEVDKSIQNQILAGCEPCRDVLNELSSLLDEYQSMSFGHKNVKDAIMWDEDKTRDMRARMTSTKVDMLILYNRFHSSQSLELLRTVRTLIDEFRAGNLESDSISSFSVGVYEDMPINEGWKRVAKDLELRGFPYEAVLEHRDLIVECILKTVGDKMEDHTHTIPWSDNSTPTVDGLSPVSSMSISTESSIDLFAGPYITPVPEDPTFVRRLVTSWNACDWYPVQTQLQSYIDSLASSGETAFLRKAVHLQAMSFSYDGKFQEAKRLLEHNVSGPLRMGGASDDTYLLSATWLGEVCLHLKERSNAILAWAVKLQRPGVFADHTRASIRNWDELVGLKWLFETSSDDIVNLKGHDIFAEVDIATKKTIVREALDFVNRHQKLILHSSSHFKSASDTSFQISEEMMTSKKVAASRCLNRDPFFYAFGAILLMQRMPWTIQTTTTSRVNLQLSRDGIISPTTRPAVARQNLKSCLNRGTSLGKTTVRGSGLIEIFCDQIEELVDSTLRLLLVLNVGGLAIMSAAVLDIVQSSFPSSRISIKLITRFDIMSRCFPVLVGSNVKPAVRGSEAHKNCSEACARLIKLGLEDIFKNVAEPAMAS